MPRVKKTYKIAVLDFETDPFKFERIPKPFAVECYCDDWTFVSWGDDCPERLMQHLDTITEPLLIFAHNGGKFDFHFLHPYLDNPIKIINARIVQSQLGIHTVRDSFSIIPIPLKAFDKDDIDYDKMERHRRERYKDEILLYLHKDCTSLFTLVSAFVAEFGTRLTVASTAMTEIKKLHTFNTMNMKGDAIFRPFYFGGRVQCFKSGIIDGPWKGYDVNSMYPKAMRDYKHPVNCSYSVDNQMPDTFDVPYFMHFRGRNYGALPTRIDDADGGLTFDVEKGEFFACSHEIEIALKYNLIEIDDIEVVYIADETTSFKEYVDFWYNRKVTAKKNKDKIGELFAKFMLNSGYGKFGQNPENFADWLLWRDYGREAEIEEKGYGPVCEFPDFELWKRPARITDSAFYDVSIAASITSAARAILLDGIQNAIDPIYCDTDSIICRSFGGHISDTELGAWKHEFDAPTAAIAGKKMLACYDPALPINNKYRSKNAPDRPINDAPFDPGRRENPIKLVSKGGTLTLPDILNICRGKRVSVASQAPTFSVSQAPRFISRTFRQTAGKSDKDDEIDLTDIGDLDTFDSVDDE